MIDNVDFSHMADSQLLITGGTGSLGKKLTRLALDAGRLQLALGESIVDQAKHNTAGR